MSFAFEMKTFWVRKLVISKRNMSYELCQNAKPENGGTTTQMRILYVLLIVLLSMVD